MPILKRFFWESNFRKFPPFRFRSIGLLVHAGNGAPAGVVEVLEGRIPFQGERFYLITGGAIKLTHLMSERGHTLNELKKMEKVRNYLIDNGIFDVEGIKEESL